MQQSSRMPRNSLQDEIRRHEQYAALAEWVDKEAFHNDLRDMSYELNEFSNNVRAREFVRALRSREIEKTYAMALGNGAFFMQLDERDKMHVYRAFTDQSGEYFLDDPFLDPIGSAVFKRLEGDDPFGTIETTVRTGGFPTVNLPASEHDLWSAARFIVAVFRASS